MSDVPYSDEYITEELARATTEDISKWSLTELVKAYGVMMEVEGEAAILGEPVPVKHEERVRKMTARVSALEAEVAALKQDAAVQDGIKRGTDFGVFKITWNTKVPLHAHAWSVEGYDSDFKQDVFGEGDTLRAALAAAGLTPKEEVKE